MTTRDFDAIDGRKGYAVRSRHTICYEHRDAPVLPRLRPLLLPRVPYYVYDMNENAA